MCYNCTIFCYKRDNKPAFDTKLPFSKKRNKRSVIIMMQHELTN